MSEFIIRITLEEGEKEAKFNFHGGKHIITFYANCHGVKLYTRGEDDPHIMFEIITEDDGGYWYSSQPISPSSYWLPEIIQLLKHTQKWMEDNCEVDGEPSDVYYGYKLKN